MNIMKFYQYLTEDIYLPIVDVVIDEQGNPYNGNTRDKIIKGSIDRATRKINLPPGSPTKTKSETYIKSIIGINGKKYPAGIDKNGNLIAVNRDSEGYALDSLNKRIPLPKDLVSKYKVSYWRDDKDYIDLVPIIPTGWVNVKVDMEIVKRVRRYSSGLGNKPGFENFLTKLEQFERLSKLKRSDREAIRLKKRTIQKEMSVIVLLHYMNEIKDFFTPSQSGFLFESFIAGLIPNAKINDDNTSADITAGQDEYQIKLYKNTSGISVTTTIKDNVVCLLDYYVIGIKHIDKIELFLINSKAIDSSIELAKELEIITEKGVFSISNLRSKSSNKDLIRIFNIELSNIEERIKNLGEELKKSIDYLYDELSKFQYNVEALITGKDERGKIADFDLSYANAENNIKNLAIHLSDITKNIKRG